MLKCFKCGATKPGTKKWQNSYYECPGGCGGRAVPASKSLHPLVEKLLFLGYEVTAAEDSFTLIDNSRMEIAVVHIELGKRYDRRVFPDLPFGWQYHTYPHYNDFTSRIILTEQYPSGTGIPTAKMLRILCSELYTYLCGLEEQHAPDIFRLAGLM